MFDLDKRFSYFGNPAVGFLRIRTALLCAAVNFGHKFEDVTRQVTYNGLMWYQGRCKLCETLVYHPINQPSHEKLVQLA